MGVLSNPVSSMNLPNSSQKPLVLVVEDNLDNLVLLQYQIATVVDCAVLTAATGTAAIDLAQQYQPDLILLDILLPDINGIQVIQQLQQRSSTAKIPIVALTALARAEDRDRICNSGCNDYLSKPYDLNDLETMITRHLPERCPL